jgi:hypothetical protein
VERAAYWDIPFDEMDIDTMRLALADAEWRICSGALYKIKIKTTDAREKNEGGGEGYLQNTELIDDSESPDPSPAENKFSEFSEFLALQPVQPFVPNRAQRRWMERIWTRNLILKSRQLGFTTLIAMIWLDHALFNANQTCVMIAQNREAAENIFQDKILLAYQNLPEVLKARMPLVRCSTKEVVFGHNGSKIRVATSARSGTLDRLHVSEFGKISARDPAKAREVVVGSLPAVPTDGIAVIESTAEGQEGEFYTMVQQAMAHVHAIAGGSKKALNRKEWRLQFFGWWQDPDCVLDDPSIEIGPEDNQYFDEIEAEIGPNVIPIERRRWWVSHRDNSFGGEDERMWQEFPSTVEEAFKTSTEGVYYAKQLAQARKSGRIGRFPHIEGKPVDTYWDIGSSDGTGIWLIQKIGGERRCVRYIEGWEEHYSFYTQELQRLGYQWGTHHLPHDAKQKRQQRDIVSSPLDDLKSTRLPGKWVAVDKVDDLQHGIQLTRQAFSTLTFDEAGCKKGLDHLKNYRKMWNRRTGRWGDTPDKASGHSEAADSLRQFAQAGGATTGGTGPSESLRRFKNRDRSR